MAEIRSLIPHAPVLAMTATATTQVRRNIQKKLAMVTSVEFVDSPDRENMKMNVRLISSNTSVVKTFQWLLDDLTEHGKDLKTHVIYIVVAQNRC